MDKRRDKKKEMDREGREEAREEREERGFCLKTDLVRQLNCLNTEYLRIQITLVVLP